MTDMTRHLLVVAGQDLDLDTDRSKRLDGSGGVGFRRIDESDEAGKVELGLVADDGAVVVAARNGTPRRARDSLGRRAARNLARSFSRASRKSKRLPSRLVS